jgi:hypothetical protein
MMYAPDSKTAISAAKGIKAESCSSSDRECIINL